LTKKTIITIHDIGFLRYPESYKKSACLYHRFSTWFAAKFASTIIVPSEFTKRTKLSEYIITDIWPITKVKGKALKHCYRLFPGHKLNLLNMGKQ